MNQETIMYELERLKLAIDQSFQSSLHHGDSLFRTLEDPFDARVSYNLRNLARVAQNFHSSASTTATTIHGSNGTSSNVLSDMSLSMSGGVGLTVDKRHQIDRYFKSMRGGTKRKPLTHAPNAAASAIVSADLMVSLEQAKYNASDICDDNDDGDDEAEFELLFLNGLEEVAKDSMLSQDFAKAESILEKAIRRQIGSSSGDTDFKKLQIQLATCYFFQRKWRLAEPLISRIAKLKANLDEVVCNLLHALALAYLADYSFEKSISICKQALWGKKRLERVLGATYAAECNETLGLLATIYETKGDSMYAEVVRRTITTGFSYEHPLNELEFIVKHPRLSQDVFGEKVTLDCRQPHTMERQLSVIPDLPHASTTALIEEEIEIFHKHCREAKQPLRTLRAKLDSYERYNKDTEKEVVSLSIPSAASDSSEEFILTNSGNSTPTSSDPEVATKRSFTRLFSQFIGTVRDHLHVSSDDLDVHQTLETENMPSPLRRKLQKPFRPTSDPGTFNIHILRTSPLKGGYERQNQREIMGITHLPLAISGKTTIGSYNEDKLDSPKIADGQVHELMGL